MDKGFPANADIIWAPWENHPRGLPGFRICAPRIPGLVVFHWDKREGVRLVAEGLMAVREEKTISILAGPQKPDLAVTP
jgi:hypothetical protein